MNITEILVVLAPVCMVVGFLDFVYRWLSAYSDPSEALLKSAMCSTFCMMGALLSVMI